MLEAILLFTLINTGLILIIWHNQSETLRRRR